MTNGEFEKWWQTLGGWDKVDRTANAVKKLIREKDGHYEDYFVATPVTLGDEQNGGG
jgi:hypothetical protein